MNKIIRIYRWIRFRHGHGVHSPFAYSFINDIVEEKNSYYGYLDVAKKIRLRSEHSSAKSSRSLKIQYLFFRIGNFFRPDYAISIGNIDTESILYLHQGCQSKIHSIIILDIQKEENAIRLFENEQNARVLFRDSKVIESAFITEMNKFGYPALIYLEKSIPTEVKQNILFLCLKSELDETILLIDGINESNQSKKFWQNLITNTDTTISFDLIYLGIIVINRKLNKQDYKLFF